jgi:HK97 family phage portal protein
MPKTAVKRKPTKRDTPRKSLSQDLVTLMAFPDFTRSHLQRKPTTAELLALYRDTVASVIDLISNSIAAASRNLCLYAPAPKMPDGWRKLDDHPSLRLLASVNPITTRSQLFYDVAACRLVDGNKVWRIIRSAAGVPQLIVPLQPQLIRPIYNTDGSAIEFVRYGTGRYVDIPYAEVVHFKYWDVANPLWGRGVVERSISAARSEQSMSEERESFYENYAIPPGVITTKTRFRNQAEAEELEQRWQDKHAGARRFRIAILGDDAKFQQIAMTAKDMDYVESRKFIRDEIWHDFHLPDGFLASENASRATTEAMEYELAKYTLAPHLADIEETLNRYFLPFWPMATGLQFEFDSVVPNDKEFELKEREANIRMALTVPDEERAKLGMPPRPDGGGGEPVISAPKIPPVALSLTKDKSMPFINIKTGPREWRRIMSYQQRIERDMRAAIRSELKRERDEVLQNMGASEKAAPHDIDGWLFDEQDAEAKLSESVNPVIKRSHESGGERAVSSVSSGLQFNPDTHAIQEYLIARRRIFAEMTSETSDLVRQTLREGIEANENMIDLQDRVRLLFDDMENYRAQRIARTETGASWNAGAREGYDQVQAEFTDAKMTKHWVSAYDDATRETHKAAHDRYYANGIPLDERFDVGGEQMDYPLDPNASAGEVINCRCSYFVEVEE